MQRLLGKFRQVGLFGLAVATACGGTTQRAPGQSDEPPDTGSAGSAGKAGSGGAVAAGSPSMQPAGMGGMSSSTGGKPPASAGSLSAPAACTTGILPAALEGCRAPNEPGCEFCYVLRPDGVCEAYSGSAARDDYFVYNVVSISNGGCERGPRCASCLRETEAALCAETTFPECDCRQPPGIDPCFAPESCGCFCQVGGQNRKACPQAD